MFAWDTSNEINETIFYIYFIDLKVSNCGYLVTHMSSHLLILEYFTCICPLASGTDGSMGKRVTMGSRLHFEVPPFDCSLESFVNADGLDIYPLARSVMSYTHLVSDWEEILSIYFELFVILFGGYVILQQMSYFWFIKSFEVLISTTHL